MIENEFKMMLTGEQYEKVLEMFSWDEQIVQTNYYYDDENLTLSAEHITCRVREIGGEYFLQMKMPAGRDFSRVELSEKLEKLPDMIEGTALSEMSGTTGLPDVNKLGSLTTNRSVKRFDGGEVDLDESRYFDITDYELEIEFTDEAAARKMMAEITEKIGVKPESDVCIGKVRHFMQAAKRR